MTNAPIILVTTYRHVEAITFADAVVITPADFIAQTYSKGQIEYAGTVGHHIFDFKWSLAVLKGMGNVRAESARAYYDRCEAAARRHGQNGIEIVGEFLSEPVDAPFLVLPGAGVTSHFDITIQLTIHTLSDLPSFDEFKLGHKRFGSPHFRAAAFNLEVGQGYSLPVYVIDGVREVPCALEIGEPLAPDMFRAKLHIPEDVVRPQIGAEINSRAAWLTHDGPMTSERTIAIVRD